jgi:hypothetical protein
MAFKYSLAVPLCTLTILNRMSTTVYLFPVSIIRCLCGGPLQTMRVVAEPHIPKLLSPKPGSRQRIRTLHGGYSYFRTPKSSYIQMAAITTNDDGAFRYNSVDARWSSFLFNVRSSEIESCRGHLDCMSANNHSRNWKGKLLYYGHLDHADVMLPFVWSKHIYLIHSASLCRMSAMFHSILNAPS